MLQIGLATMVSVHGERGEQMRLIDVEPVLDSLKKEEQYAHDRFGKAPYNGLLAWGMVLQEVGAVIHELESQPTIDAVPVRHGKWTDGDACSECGCQPWYERDIHTLNYCPNCGARMDAERREE